MKAAMHGLEEAQKKSFEVFRLAEAKHKVAVADWIKHDKKGSEPTPPQLASFYIGDATLESICNLLDTNPRGLLQMRDELSGWLGGFDKYSEGNEAAQWLEFHSGNSVRIDRKGGDKKTIYIPRALVSVTGTIQEPVLRKLLSGDDAKHFDNGLAARFLMVMPPEIERHWREAILVDIKADVTQSLVQRIAVLGGNVINSYPEYRAIQAAVPLSEIENLAAQKEVAFIQPVEHERLDGGNRKHKLDCRKFNASAGNEHL
jgi:hypothetical protein